MHDEYPSRIGVGDGPEMPCSVVGFDFTCRGGEVVVYGHRGADGALHIDQAEPRDVVATVAVDTAAFTEALTRTVEALRQAARAAESSGERMRALVEQAGFGTLEPYDLTRPAEVFVSMTAPGVARDEDWPAPTGTQTCAHVCGPDPGHVCEARAVTMLRHKLPSGGTRELPLCGPCHTAEAVGIVRDNPGASNRETADRTGRA